MESDDENFAWTDTSSDTNSNSSMAITNENGVDDFETESSSKKKIKKELFKNEHHIKEESGYMKNPKKRKHEDLENSATDEPRNKHVKREPENNLDVHDKKRKSKISESDNVLEEESLNIKVKQEQPSAENISSNTKKKKKKKQRQDSNESTLYTSCLDESQSIKFENSQNDDSIINISRQSQEDDQFNVKEEKMDIDDSRSKKKKLKKIKKERLSAEQAIIKENFSGEETIVDLKSPKVILSESIKGGFLENGETSYSLHNTNGKSNDSDYNLIGDEHQNSISMIEPNNLSVDIIDFENNCKSSDKVISSNRSKDLSKRISKLSDQTRFEDTFNLSQNEECSNMLEDSKQLKRFLKINNHLKQISPKVREDTMITDDDELWLLKCPSEVNVKSLKDTTLVLDNKCKLKADSQTYVGFIENNIDGITLMTLDQSKPVLKNVTLSGIVQFHKRIPKTYYVEHNVMEEDGNFIPLPEIKHRHPLFGSDYKSSIKIPESVAQRLNGYEPESISYSNEKRKKKKKKIKQEVNMSDNEHQQEHDHEEVRKKRKRKLSHYDEVQSKPPKKSKHESETWESEKAIEQQLFNF